MLTDSPKTEAQKKAFKLYKRVVDLYAGGREAHRIAELCEVSFDRVLQILGVIRNSVTHAEWYSFCALHHVNAAEYYDRWIERELGTYVPAEKGWSKTR